VAANGGLTRHNWSVKSAEAQRQITRKMESAANRIAPGHARAGFALPDWLAVPARGGEAAYFAAGGLQAAIRSFVRELDPGDAQLLRSAHHLPEEDHTRVILAGDSRTWRSRGPMRVEEICFVRLGSARRRNKGEKVFPLAGFRCRAGIPDV
jgi:hypothetical protein